jgi:hypothetical protein
MPVLKKCRVHVARTAAADASEGAAGPGTKL